MNPAQNMELFRELVRCGSEIYTWCYDTDGRLLECNCPEIDLLSSAFSILGCKKRMLAYWQNHNAPVTLGSGLGLTWGAAFEQKNGQPYRAWVIGPYFYTDVSIKSIADGLHTYMDVEVSIAWKRRFIDILYQLPAVSHLISSRYLLMMHYCLTGERLMISELQAPLEPSMPTPQPMQERRDRHKVWSAEQRLLQMVRNGDLDFKHALSNAAMLSNGVQIQGRDPLQQVRISCIVFCSIVCRAAIEGGLSPEVAYALGDSYIQSIVDARKIDEVMSYPNTMYEDFILRVHKLRTNPKLSVPVQKCVDYIEMHLSERIRASDLASVAGYGEYYVTQKFKEETGSSVNNYVKFVKIERAKTLLRTTDYSVQEIADLLGFATRNHFSQSFKQVAGCSPMEYRTQSTKNICYLVL